MARRKINKRVLILLLVFGGVFLALALTIALKGCGGKSLLDWVVPKDPVVFIGRARKAYAAVQDEAAVKAASDPAAYKEEKFREADEAFREAIEAGAAQDSPDVAKYYYEYARMCYDWFRDGSGLTRTERGERFAATADLLRKALARNRKYVEAQRFLAQMYWGVATGRRDPRGWSEYAKEATKLLQLDPNDHETHFRRGRAKAALSQNIEGEVAREAIADLRKAVELKTDGTMYWLGLIDFLRQLPGRHAEADDVFREAVEANLDQAPLLIAYGHYLRREGDTAAAEQRFREAIKIDPMLGNLALADHYHRLNKLDEALAALDEAQKIDALDPRPYLSKARIYGYQQKSAEAISVLRSGLAAVEKVTATQPDDRRRLAMRSARAELYYLLGNVLLDLVEGGDKDKDKLLDQARDCLQKLTLLNVGGPLHAKVAGRIALAEGKYTDALQLLEQAYAGFRRFDLKTGNLLMNLYLRQNLPGKAERILDRLLSMPGQRTNVSALMAKVQLLMRYRAYDRAGRIVDAVLDLDPNNPAALNTKLVLSAVRGELPSLPPKVPLTRSAIQMLLDRSAAMWLDGQREEAVRYVEQLHERVPTDRTVVGRLSSMYRAMKRVADAEKILNDALKAHPDDPALKSRLALLRETDRAKQREILLKAADELPPLQRALEKAGIMATYGMEKEYFQYLQEAAGIDPNAQGVVDRLFRYALRKQDWNLAEDCVRRAQKANLDGSGGRYYEARLALVREDYDGVIAAAQEMLDARPNRKSARVLLGQAYLQKKLYDKAYEAFHIVVRNDPGYAPALIGLAAVTEAQGKTVEHEEYVQRAYRLAPRDAYIRERYLEIRQRTAKPAELIAQRERTLKNNPNDLRNILGLGILYEQTARLEDAERMYVTLHQRAQNKLYSARVLAGFYLRLRRQADFDRVMTALLDSWPDRVGALVLYGEFLKAIDLGRAERALKKAIAVDGEDPRGYLGTARFYATTRQWRKAVEFMSRYVRLRSQDPTAEEELIRYLIEAGEHSAATRRLDRILGSDPTHAAALALKGAIAARQGQVKKALGLYEEAIRANANYDEPLVLRARLYLARGEPERARSDLEQAYRLSARIDTAMQLAAVHRVLRDYDSAERIYREVLRRQPDYSPAIDRLIAIYGRRQKWDPLEKLLVTGKKLFPKNPGYYLAEATMWRDRADGVKRLAALAKAVEVAPDSPLPLRTYLATLQQAGQYQKVLTVCEPYLNRKGFGPWVGAIRAAAMAKLNRPEEADKLFVQAIGSAQPADALLIVQEMQRAYGLAGATAKFDAWLAARPGDWQLCLMLGVLHGQAEHYAESVETLLKARSLATSPDQRFLTEKYLGTHYYQLRNFGEAEKAYLASLKINPADVQSLNNLAYMYTNDLGQAQKALPYAAAAARRLPSNARVLDTYGWTLAKLDKLDEAEQYLIRAVQLEAPLAASRYHLGWVYEKMKRFDEALKQYRQGFEMVRTKTKDPLHEVLKKALERVRQKLQPGSVK